MPDRLPALRQAVYRLLPKPRADASRERPAERVLVLSLADNPTFSYYLEERIAHLPAGMACTVRSPSDDLDDVDPQDLHVVINRYLAPRQAAWLFRHRARLAGTALFLDDDLAATIVGSGAARGYRAWIFGLGVAPLPLINGLLTGVWASTPALARTIGATHIVGPRPPASALAHRDGRKGAASEVLMAFHATGSHAQEHAFLIPIVRRALAAFPQLRFEAIAPAHALPAWQQAGLPAGRTRLAVQKPWKDYLEDTAVIGRDILLVPLLDGPVNAVRADTKRIDAVRMGAAAILSSSPAYLQHADPGEVLVDNEPEGWFETIGRLVSDAAARVTASEASKRVVAAMADRGPAGLPVLFRAGNHEAVDDGNR